MYSIIGFFFIHIYVQRDSVYKIKPNSSLTTSTRRSKRHYRNKWIDRFCCTQRNVYAVQTECKMYSTQSERFDRTYRVRPWNSYDIVTFGLFLQTFPLKFSSTRHTSSKSPNILHSTNTRVQSQPISKLC